MPGLSGQVIDLANPTPAELDALATQSQPAAAPTTTPPLAPPIPHSPLPIPPSPPSAFPLQPSALSPFIPHLPTLWLIGAPLTFTLLATGLVGSARLRRRATPLLAGPAFEACERLRQTLKITRRVALAVSDDVAQPILVGVLRPLILLPAAALAGWTPEQLDMVLLHELAHVRRRDNLVNLLQRIVESILFFHPAVWLVSRQVRRDREECCDAAVIRHTDRPEAYATLLIDIASRLRLSPSLSPAHSLTVASAMASHPLAGRIRRILNIEEEPMRITRRTLAATLLLPALLAGAMLYSGANAEDGSNPPPSQEQPSTVASGDRAQGGSANEEKGGIEDANQASETNGKQDNNNRATNELSQALTDLEQRKQALLDAEAELAAVESRIAQFTHAELTEKYADIHWKSAPEREILLQQGAAIIAQLKSRTASGASADDAAVQQLQAALAEVRKEDNELRESLKANIWKQAAEDSEFSSKLQNTVRDQEHQRANHKVNRARHEFKASITRLEQLAAGDAGAMQESTAAPTSSNQTGDTVRASRADVNLPQLQTEIRNLAAIVAKSKEELVNFELYKQIVGPYGRDEAKLRAAITEVFEQDPTIAKYKEQLATLQTKLEAQFVASKDPDASEIIQLRSIIEKTEAEFMKYRREAERSLRDKLAKPPRTPEELAAEREYEIRRKVAEENVAKYQQQLAAAEARLSALDTSVGSLDSRSQGAAATESSTGNAPPTDNAAAHAAASAKDLDLPMAEFKKAFEPRQDNPSQTINYSTEKIPQQYDDQWEDIFEGMQADPYGPQVTFAFDVAADQKHIRITAPTEAHRQIFTPFFAGDWLKARKTAPKPDASPAKDDSHAEATPSEEHPTATGPPPLSPRSKTKKSPTAPTSSLASNSNPPTVKI